MLCIHVHINKNGSLILLNTKEKEIEDSSGSENVYHKKHLIGLINDCVNKTTYNNYMLASWIASSGAS